MEDGTFDSITGLCMNLLLRLTLLFISIRELLRSDKLLEVEPIEKIELKIVNKIRKKVRKNMMKEMSIIIEE